jgi:hypothetical protein
MEAGAVTNARAFSCDGTLVLQSKLLLQSRFLMQNTHMNRPNFAPFRSISVTSVDV